MLNGNMISFGSRMHTQVTMSTTTSEYLALSEAAKELLWLHNVLAGMGVKIKKPMTIFEDNKTCCKLDRHPISAKRTKHLKVRHHWIRDHVFNGDFSLEWVSSSNMLAEQQSHRIKKVEAWKVT